MNSKLQIMICRIFLIKSCKLFWGLIWIPWLGITSRGWVVSPLWWILLALMWNSSKHIIHSFHHGTSCGIHHPLHCTQSTARKLTCGRWHCTSWIPRWGHPLACWRIGGLSWRTHPPVWSCSRIRALSRVRWRFWIRCWCGVASGLGNHPRKSLGPRSSDRVNSWLGWKSWLWSIHHYFSRSIPVARKTERAFQSAQVIISDVASNSFQGFYLRFIERETSQYGRRLLACDAVHPRSTNLDSFFFVIIKGKLWNKLSDLLGG